MSEASQLDASTRCANEIFDAEGFMRAAVCSYFERLLSVNPLFFVARIVVSE